MSAPAGTEFYVSATGSDSNSGKSASSPMASLASLLNVYTLQPGDIINVGSGTYVLPSAIVLGASDSGAAGDPIQIIGQGASTIFESASTAASTSIFEFDGAHDVTLENLALVGGGTGVDIVPNSGDVDISLQGLNISGFSTSGVNVGAGATSFSITGSNIHDPVLISGSDVADGVDIDASANATISNDTFSKLRYGVNITTTVALTISGSTFNADNEGINANYSGSTISYLNVDNNTVTSSTTIGMYLAFPQAAPGLVSIEGNTVTGSGGVGIEEFGAATIEGNTTSNGVIGLEVSGGNVSNPLTYVYDNTVTGNSNEGINIGGVGANVTGNTISGNNIGVFAQSSASNVTNNLFLNNTSIGISNTLFARILNNTLVQAGGIAIQNTSTSTTNIENNIFQMTGGTVFNVGAADQLAFSSNYNMFDLLGGATMANWGGHRFRPGFMAVRHRDGRQQPVRRSAIHRSWRRQLARLCASVDVAGYRRWRSPFAL